MRNQTHRPFFCLLLLFLCPDCTSPNPTYDPCVASQGTCSSAPPPLPPSTFSVQTPTLSKQQGGSLEFTLPSEEITPPLWLNQSSSTDSYVLAKLVSAGVASLDLVVQSGKNAGHFFAVLTPQDLTPFHGGRLTLQVTTSFATHMSPITLE